MVRQATTEDLTIFDTYSLNHGKLTKFGVTCNVETYWSSSKGKQWNQHGDNPVAEPMEALQHVKLPYRTLPIHQCMAHPWWPNHDISAVVPPCDAPCYALLRPGAPALWGFLGTIFPGSDAISGSWDWMLHDEANVIRMCERANIWYTFILALVHLMHDTYLYGSLSWLYLIYLRWNVCWKKL